MFGSRRKILGKGDTVYIFAPAREAVDEFLGMTTASTDFHSPWVFPATDARRFRGYLDRLESGTAMGFFIGRRADDALIGVVNVNDIVMGGLRTGTLGYYIGADFARQGFMTAGLGLVLDYVFTTGDLHRIESNIQPSNAASIALVRKLGFRKEGFSLAFMQIDGVWRDHERWAILSSEWIERKSAARQQTRRSVIA